MTETISDLDANRSWQDWRAGRRRSLTGPRGNLALVDTYWPETDSVFDELPGVWTVRDDRVWLTATADEEVRVADEPVAGETPVSHLDGAPSPWLDFPGGSATVVRRGDQLGIRRFDPQAAAIADFEDVDAFDFAPRWQLTGTFTRFAAATTVDYEKMLEDSPTPTNVPGELRFTVAGREYTTTPMLSGGLLLLVFADETTGVSTYQPGRFLRVALPDSAPGEAVPVRLDFNRAYLPPCAFSAHFNCPLPPPGHRLATAVTAGEQRVRLRTSQPG
ncbi:hypothetical protein FHR81_003369 [Actinoalloteichus hoggarensis]|uniref:Uncharacterized protein n=1 Tax=Actinoalloteichus hoggarensis TaxID=1470176 RepID=A0A221W7T4_9PSEU|nr:DUF1684 domain-containing protein [Actinoalloteichus hoggarensis]ASO21721.1 hypothetical protein AHOG_20520 [Actinoalloteichus hoggarensis]MBB5922317.1 hypothetical protein [Actinoalloteichus hoggarensis]